MDDKYKKAEKYFNEIEELWNKMNEELAESKTQVDLSELKIKNSDNEDRIDHCLPFCFDWQYIKFLLEGGDPKDWEK